MRLSENVPSVWPGYVAAIASLVLSLLLLLAILVFALTQVGHLVTAYAQELLRATLQSEQDQTAPKNEERLKPAQQVGRIEGLHIPAAQSPKEPVAPGTPLRQIRLVFGAELSDIPAAQAAEVAAAILQTQAPEDAGWLIWAQVLSGDVLMERAAYRLMLAVRKNLMAQGVSEKKIELQIKTATTPPTRYKQGEIIVYLAPLHLTFPGRTNP